MSLRDEHVAGSDSRLTVLVFGDVVEAFTRGDALEAHDLIDLRRVNESLAAAFVRGMDQDQLADLRKRLRALDKRTDRALRDTRLPKALGRYYLEQRKQQRFVALTRGRRPERRARRRSAVSQRPAARSRGRPRPADDPSEHDLDRRSRRSALR